jgi:hypothetical protein
MGTSEQVRVQVRVVLFGQTSPFSLTFSSSYKPVSAQSLNSVLIDRFWQHSHCTVNTISPGAFSPYTVISVEIEIDRRGHPLTGGSEPG